MTTTASPLEVAETIRKQIGHSALYMMGAKNLLAGDDYLSFQIFGCKHVSHIRITLEGTDTYKIEFIKIRGYNMTTPATTCGVYCDAINGIIEAETGLTLSL
jgi:hypothetical protein